MSKVVKFAANKHKDQVRRGTGLPYIVHPFEVALLLVKYGRPDLVEVALLHDTLEDTQTTVEEIVENFGPTVAELVKELTSDRERIKKMGKNPYLIDKMKKMSQPALLVKLCDRLSNISDGPTEKYLADTRTMMVELMLDPDINSDRDTVTIMLDIAKICFQSIDEYLVALTGDVNYQPRLFTGPGNSGKSMLPEMIRTLIDQKIE